MEDLFAMITATDRSNMQMRKAEFVRDPAGKMQVFLGVGPLCGL
jgi:hypothetical protein